MSNWTDNLKPGDPVIAFEQRCRVPRLNATQVVFDLNGREYRARRKDRRIVGYSTGFRKKLIHEATSGALAKLQAVDNRSWARYSLRTETNLLTDQQITRLRAFVELLQAEAQ